MINDKRIIAIWVVLLSVMSVQATYRQTTVTLNNNGREIAAEAQIDDNSNVVIVGNGQNACIPQYTAGTLTVPGSVNIGGSVYRVVVGQLAFRLCNSLTEVIIEEGVTQIGDFAFVGCSSLEKVTLPSTMNNIGSGAFVNLSSLKEMTCRSTDAPFWGYNDLFAHEGTANATSAMANQRTLYVPRNCAASYRARKYDNSVGWEEAFGRISEATAPSQRLEIASFDDLHNFMARVNGGDDMGDYIIQLTADLIFEPSNDTRGNWYSWHPIGTPAHPFKGVFDGGGHTIKNIKEITGSGSIGNGSNIGLFGYCETAAIGNLVLQNISMAGENRVGVVAGSAISSNIYNILVYDAVASGEKLYCATATNGYAGGVVGYAQNCKIDDCYFYGKVKGTDGTGGIVGASNGLVTITDCASAYSIEGGAGPTGGIVGTADSGTNVARSYSRAMLTSSSQATQGGIVGTYTERSDNYVFHCAYYKCFDNLPTAATTGSGGYLRGDIRECDNLSDMEDLHLQDVFGQGNWFFFKGDTDDYPVPRPLKEAYLLLAGMKDHNGFIFKHVPESGTDGHYMIVGYEGSATDITLPQLYKDLMVMEIGERAFADKPLTSVVIPNLIFNIGEQAFANCKELKSISIGSLVRSPYNGWLDGCSQIDHIYVAEDNQFYSTYNFMLFYNNHSTTNPQKTLIRCTRNCISNLIVNAEEKDMNIADGAFAGCNNIPLVDLRESSKEWRVSRSLPSSPFYDAGKYTLFILNDMSKPLASEPNVVFRKNSTDTYYSCYELIVAEHLGFNSPVSFKTASARLDRSFEPGIQRVDGDEDTGPYFENVPSAYTFHLPFKPMVPYGKGVKLYSYAGTSVKNGVTLVNFNELRNTYSSSSIYELGQIHVNHPYYLIVESGGPYRLSTNEYNDIQNGEHSGIVEHDVYKFIGTNSYIPNFRLYNDSYPRYILQSDKNWHRVPYNQPKAFLNAFRCFFEASSTTAAKTLTPNFGNGEDETTGFPNTVICTTDNDGSQHYYDLNGRRLQGKPQRGLYIHNRHTYRAK